MGAVGSFWGRPHPGPLLEWEEQGGADRPGANLVVPTVAHALHGKAIKLTYASPVTGEVVIFDHDSF